MNDTSDRLKEDFKIIRALGQQYGIPKNVIERSCRSWKRAVLEAGRDFKPFSFRDLRQGNVYKKRSAMWRRGGRHLMVPIVTVSGGGDGADKKDLCHNKGYPMPGPHLHLVRGPKKPACEAETPEAVKTKMEPTERYNSNRTISFAARVRII